MAIKKTYLWNDGSVGSTLSVTASGTYTLIVTDGNGCPGDDTIEVLLYPIPEPLMIRHE